MNQATVLVVDDELFFRTLYSELLGEDGYVVEPVNSGEEALDRLRRGGVDIVLSDLVMPGIGGLELLHRIRAMDNPPDVILVTGHATMETAIEALKSGARDYLVKPFKPEELRHLVRTCIEQRRLLDENSLLKSQIRLFQRGQNLASLIEIDRLLPLSITTLLAELGGGRGFAFLHNENDGPRILGGDGVTEERAQQIVHALIPLSDEFHGLKQLSSQDLPGDGLFDETCASLWFFPLHCDKHKKGGLILLPPTDGTFVDPFPFDSLLFLCEQTTLAFENAFRYQGARELIYTDDLTGLYNYRYLQIVLDQEIRRTERYGLSFALIFIDLDHFKDINDTRGHLAGSESLREIAGLLRKSVREVDVLFRYGGDEFTALLVETDTRGAAVVAERIRRTIEQFTFLAESETPARLTATVGYATFPENAGDKKNIIDMADRAMYEGKKQRNVTRGAWEIPPP